jgi:hypothetical protein
MAQQYTLQTTIPDDDTPAAPIAAHRRSDEGARQLTEAQLYAAQVLMRRAR